MLFDASKQLFGSPSRTMNCMRTRTKSMTTAMSLPPATGSSPQPHLLPSPGGSISVNTAVAISLYNSQPLSASTTHHFNSHCFFCTIFLDASSPCLALLSCTCFLICSRQAQFSFQVVDPVPLVRFTSAGGTVEPYTRCVASRHGFMQMQTSSFCFCFPFFRQSP